MISLKRSFASDNNAGVSQEVLQWLNKVNHGHVLGYGDDPYSKQALQLCKQHFGVETQAFFVFTGTAANVLGLSQLLKSTEAVICAHDAHINEHECGALQNFHGSRLFPLHTPNGKLTVNMIEAALVGIGDEHYSQAKMISITQANEKGFVYSLAEIKQLAAFAKSHDLLLHMDGARLANAAVSLGVSLKEATFDLGIDVLSFGGTKNGLMAAEAVIFANTELAQQFQYTRKQGMQLVSKMRFIAAQFIALLETDLWQRNAQQANNMAKLFAKKLAKYPQITIMHEVLANMLFVQMPTTFIHHLQDHFAFYVMDQKQSIIRLVCSFDTHENDIDHFVACVEQLIS